MVPRLHSSWQKIKQHPFIVAGIIVAIFALIAFIFAVQRFGWDWTGFTGGESKITITSTSKGITTAKELQSGKALWDWLGLLATLAIPVVVGFGAAWFTAQQGKVSVRENKDNQRETALQAYIDKISELLLDKQLRESQPQDEARTIARVRTLTTLPRLDTVRKGGVIHFLYESQLISKDNTIINLEGAELSGAELSGAELSGADLNRANLSGANLSGANLSAADLTVVLLVGADLSRADLTDACLIGADLTDAKLSRADLTDAKLGGAKLGGAKLSEADLSFTKLHEADLSGADLSRAQLGQADLSGAHLHQADLSGAHLHQADLSSADLSGANLSGADLSGAKLIFARLSGADLNRADLNGADLSFAYMSGAKIDKQQLAQTKSLRNATMSNGSKHP